MTGCEWVIEARGCRPECLASQSTLEEPFRRLVEGMHLNPVAEAVWYQFPGPGGLTGMLLLSESHLACHTFPEHRSICLNVFCCRPRPEYDFKTVLREHLGAADITVRRLEREYGA